MDHVLLARDVNGPWLTCSILGAVTPGEEQALLDAG